MKLINIILLIQTILIPIETEKEWKIIETIFEQLQAEAGKQAEGDSEQ